MKKTESLFMVNTASDSAVGSEFVTVDGEPYICIRHVDQLNPFLMSVVSDSDHWLFVGSNSPFTAGRIEEEDVDTTLGLGRPNVWKFYVDGQLSRIRRNTHCANGKADTWEIYYNDRLERVGNDATCDGHVDRWDRDAQLMAAEEAAQDKAAAPDAGPGGSSPMTVGVNGEIVDGGAPAPAKAPAKKKGK